MEEEIDTKANNYAEVDKVTKKAPISLQGPTNNWVHGDNGYINLDKFICINVQSLTGSYLEIKDSTEFWGVIGKYVNRNGSFDEFIIKKYKKKENAYGWLEKVMGGNNES